MNAGGKAEVREHIRETRDNDQFSIVIGDDKNGAAEAKAGAA